MTSSHDLSKKDLLSSLPDEILSLPLADEGINYQIPPLSYMQWMKQGSRLSPEAPAVNVPNAILIPPGKMQSDVSTNNVQGGVCDADGNFESAADHYSSLWPWVESSGQWRGEAQSKPWRVLYGGVAREHFGHFITESLGRIWLPSDHLDQICFLRSPVGPPSVEGLELLKLFEGLPPVSIIDTPTRVKEAIVPLQGSASEFGLICLRDFAVKLRKRLAPHISSGGDRSIYVSRSRFEPPAGRYFSGSIVQEDVLESHLSQAGYEIYHPQEHSVSHQVETYRSSANILINEGTALHLVALSASPSTRVAVLGRRCSHIPTFESYLETFLEPQHMRRVLRSGLLLDVNNWGERWLVIDYPKLCDQLIRRGMLPQGTSWSAHTANLADVHRRVAQLGPNAVVSRQR